MRAVCRVTDAWKSGHAPRAQAALFLVVLSGVRQASLGAGCGSTARGAGQLLFQNPSSAVVRGTAGGRQVVSATGRCKVTAAPVAPWRTSARALLRARFALRAEPVARSDADAAGDDLGALLRTWGAEDAREALEANGFTSAQRIRDLLEVDDLPELGLPLATRKILARLIKHLADEKKRGQAAAVKERVASLLDDRGSFADDAQGLVLREAAAQKRKADNDLYNKDATVTLRKWENFHRVISQEISDGAGQLELRAIEEIELDAPVNEDALNTSQVPPREEGDDLPHTVPLSGGRGGRHEAARRRVLAPPTPVEQGQKQKRHFRYRTRDGDFFVKVVLTGEPVDIRSDDEKQDEAGDVMDMFLSGNLEDGNPDLRALFMGQGVDVADADLNGGGGLALGGDGAGCNLILDIPEDLQTQLLGAKEPDQALKYPHTFYRGEQVSLATIRSTAQMLVPAPIVAGDLLDPEYVANHMDARRPASDLVSGGYGVLEWVELQRNLNPTVVSDVAEQLARMHLASAGMSHDYGFSVNTFLGEREQDNTMQEGVDVLDFFTSRRLEPELDAACRSSTKRAGTIPPKLLDEIGVKGFKIMERLQESDVWRDLIFSPVREQGPRLLHGDLWLGNMAIDTQSRPYVVGPASWYGPAAFDTCVFVLSVFANVCKCV